MPNAFTHYWIEKQNEDSQSKALQHVASNDFRTSGVRPGDFIYCVTQQKGQLFLIARMKVAEILSAQAASDFLKMDVGFEDRHDHCVCSSADGSLIQFDRELPGEIARRLRFVTKAGEVTSVTFDEKGGVKRQAMRAVRRLTPASAQILDSIIDYHAKDETIFPDEVAEPERFFEGALITVKVNKFERSSEARNACLRHYTARCQVCDFTFPEKYDGLGESFMHVHHLIPLSQIREGYQIDPIADLRPVCPNCHAMLHQQEPPFTIEELRRRLRC